MNVKFGILIGNGPGEFKRKAIDLDFAPSVGMVFDDGTWGGSCGRKIIEVVIEVMPEGDVTIRAALEQDSSDALSVLKPMYELAGWH